MSRKADEIYLVIVLTKASRRDEAGHFSFPFFPERNGLSLAEEKQMTIYNYNYLFTIDNCFIFIFFCVFRVETRQGSNEGGEPLVVERQRLPAVLGRRIDHHDGVEQRRRQQ